VSALQETNVAPIFVGGASRSGTTLLRVILNTHPSIVCGPELKVTPLVCRLWQDFHSAFFPTLRQHHLQREDIARGFRDLLASLLEKDRVAAHKPRVAEKSPDNVFFFPHLHHLFPDSPLIHVIRDGRDVVCSLLGMNWSDPRTGRRTEYTTDARKAAAYWVRAVQMGRAAAQRQPSLANRYFEIRYEQLISDPEATLRPLFAFLGESWHPCVLRFYEQTHNLAGESSARQVSAPINSSALARWQRELSSDDKAAVKEIAGPLLSELGYAANDAW